MQWSEQSGIWLDSVLEEPRVDLAPLDRSMRLQQLAKD